MSQTIERLLTEIRDELRLIRAGERPKVVADDADLDSQWGDEEVKLDPRGWTGDLMKGRRMSETSPEFLDKLAEAFDWFAKKNKGTKTDKGVDKSTYDDRSAARARGWAQRLRAGWTRPDAAYEEQGDAAGFGAF